MAETKTFLFTDIVASVALKAELPGHSVTERDGSFIELVLTPHREKIERNLSALGGRVVSTAGDGHFLVFSNSVSATRWAIGLQRSHRDEPILTPGNRAVEVRVSMHLGSPQVDPSNPDNFVGKAVDYAARLCDYACGGQILSSRSIVSLLQDEGLDDIVFHSHGKHELKGIGRVEVCELIYDGSRPRAARVKPRQAPEEEWTVLPPSMNLADLQPDDRSIERHAAPTRTFTRSTSKTADLPRRLGNYELVQRLGSGGMGEVYRARHIQNGLVRAVKVIKSEFISADQQDVVQRFYQEIKAVCQLNHPNIVMAIDSSLESNDVHYLVMEYIEGIGVEKLVAKNGPLAVADACEIARQAARGLTYIHEHDMVHRDIKPSNFMVTIANGDVFAGVVGMGLPSSNGDRRAVVKILDLGLALLVGEDQQRLTLSDHRPMGTAMYMAPEQWKTTSVDIRADIYSLGCTLYHMLAGNPPFLESDLKPEKAHEREKVPPLPGELAVPRGLWNIIQRMMAKQPKDRFRSPAELVDALAEFAEGNRLTALVGETGSAASHSRISDTAGRSGNSDTRNRTSRITAHSSTRLSRARRSWPYLTACLAVVIAAASIMLWRTAEKMSLADVIVTQPGLTGAWWFDANETPWLIPELRQRLLPYFDPNGDRLKDAPYEWKEQVKEWKQQVKELTALANGPDVYEFRQKLKSVRSQELPNEEPSSVNKRNRIIEICNNLKLTGSPADDRKQLDAVCEKLVGDTSKIITFVQSDLDNLHLSAADCHLLAVTLHRKASYSDVNDSELPAPINSSPVAGKKEVLEAADSRKRLWHQCNLAYTSAIEKYTKEKENDRSMLALCYADWAQTYFAQSNYESAIEKYEKAASYSVARRSPLLSAVVFIGQADAYCQLSQYHLAHECLVRAETFTSKLPKYHPLRAYLYERTAWFYMEPDNNSNTTARQNAKKYFGLAIAIREQNTEIDPRASRELSHDKHGMALALQYEGIFDGKKDSLEESKVRFEEIVTELTEQLKPDGKALIYRKDPDSVTKQVTRDLEQRKANSLERRADGYLFGSPHEFKIAANYYLEACNFLAALALDRNIQSTIYVSMLYRRTMALAFSSLNEDEESKKKSLSEAKGLKRKADSRFEGLQSESRSLVILRTIATAAVELASDKSKEEQVFKEIAELIQKKRKEQHGERALPTAKVHLLRDERLQFDLLDKMFFKGKLVGLADGAPPEN